MKLLNYKEFKQLKTTDYENSIVEVSDEKEQDLKKINEYIEYELNEGIFARMIGGLTGLALGKAVGNFLVRTFQVQEGTVLHKILTSRMFYMAIGAALGKSSPKTKDQSPK